ncbi:MAG: TRAP transporter substrate-binding protein DctP [Deltaproteobacteria bacterium]|nr:TRAP transporter substrate-binding protein DctP [Deltaproteobacteria bacterium]
MRLAWLSALPLLLLGGLARGETVLRLGSISPEGSRTMRDLRSLAKEIERLSGGELRIRWFGGGRLGDEKAMATDLLAKDGRLDGGLLSDVGLQHVAPEMRTWAYPGMFQDFDEVDHVESAYRADYGEVFQRAGLVFLGWAHIGFKYVFSQAPIRNLAELRQYPTWFWSDDEGGRKSAEMLGLKIVHSSLAELVADLPKGKIQAWVFPPMGVLDFGLSGHARYVSQLRYSFVTAGLVLRQDAFNALPESHRRLVQAVFHKWERRLMKAWREENERALRVLGISGVVNMPVTDQEREEFFQAAGAQRSGFARAWGIEPMMQRFTDDLQALRDLRRRR